MRSPVDDEARNHGGAEREAPTLESFLARELAGRICDAELVRRRFAFEFPDERPEMLDRGIEGAGYYMDHGLLFREGSIPSDHFTRLLAEHPSFAKGDAGFENAVWQHPAFRHVLRQALSDHRVLLYEGDSYISFARLHDVLGARMADIESYAPAVSVDAPEGEPFTVASLRAAAPYRIRCTGWTCPTTSTRACSTRAGSCAAARSPEPRCSSPEAKGGFPQPTSSSGSSPTTRGSSATTCRGCSRTIWGITCPAPLLTTTIYNSDVYYDDIGDAYYSSMEAWKKEARNELA